MTKPYSAWLEEDLQWIIDHQVNENLELEYKGSVDLSGKKGRKELCKDISAFANSYGGILIVGLKETDQKEAGSIPVGLNPITDASLKEDIQKVLADGIKPKTDFRIWPIKAEGKPGEYLVFEVPKSLRGLHMVTLAGENRFYQRLEYEAKPMSPYEIEDSYRAYLSTEKEAIDRLNQYKGANPNNGLNRPRSAWLSVTVVPRFPSKGMFIRYSKLSKHEFIKIPRGMQTDGRLEGIDEFRPTFEGAKAEYIYKSELDDNQNARAYWHTIYREGVAHFGIQIFGGLQEIKILSPLNILFELHDILSFVAGLYVDAGYAGPLDILIELDCVGGLVVQSRSRKMILGEFKDEKMTTDHFSHVLSTTPRDLEENIPLVIQEGLDHLWHSFGRNRCDFYHPDRPGEYNPAWISIVEKQGITRIKTT